MARFNDLEAGFEKHLALAYGRHIITGHLIEHSVGLEGGAASSIPDADQRVVLKVALGDGAPDVDGEGAWCGPEIVNGGGASEVEIVGVTAPVAGDAVNSPAATQIGDLMVVSLRDSLNGSPTGGGFTLINFTRVFDPIAAFSHFVFYKFATAAGVQAHDLGANGDGNVMMVVLRNLHATEFFWDEKTNKNDNDSDNLLSLPSITSDTDGHLSLVFSCSDVAVAAVGPAGYTEQADSLGHQLYSKTISPAGDTGILDVTLASPQSASGYHVVFKPPASEPGGITLGDTCSLEVIYAGETIPPENWHFHPGTLSNGVADVIQGIDAFFPNGLTYNASAYLTVILPEGFDEDADASKLAIIVHTSQIADYDATGVRNAIAYSVNPSRVKANMLRRIGQLERIYWPKYISSRDYYDEEIEAPVGTDNSYLPFNSVPDYDTLGPITANAGTGAIARTGGSGYDNKAVTQQRIVGGQEGSFSATLGDDFPTFEGGGEMHLVDEQGTAYFGVAWGNGHLGVLANGVAIEDKTVPYDLPAEAGDEIELVVDNGFFLLKQNGVTKTIPQGAASAPDDIDLFGQIRLVDADAEVTASHFVGQEVDEQTTATEMIPRFEAHPAFTGPIDIATALDFVDFLSASETQDAGRYIVFLTPEARASVHTFDDEINVVGGTVKVYPTDIRNRPNRLWAKYRNLDLRYLDQDSVFDLRDELFDKVGRPIDPGALNFASMRGSQAQRLIRFEMRRRSDNKIWCELTGMDDSFKVLPGDVVTVISRKFARVPKDFLVISATRDSPEALSGGLRRDFVLHEYFPDDYKDTDHEVPQPPVSTQPPSPFAGPTAPVLQLAQSTIEGVGGALITKIIGTVYFAVGAAQMAKIYVTTPTLAEAYTGITVTPASGSNVGTFEYFPTEMGLYTFRAEAIVVATGVVGGSATREITVGDLIIEDGTGEFVIDDDTGALLVEG